jgi:hypothetical protein
MPTNNKKNEWLKAYKEEIKNLIHYDTFKLNQPGPNDQVISTTAIFKAKQAQDGTLEKLKI